MCNTYAEDGLPKTYSQQVGAAWRAGLVIFVSLKLLRICSKS